MDVWWDKEIAGGDKWRQRILTELESAKCVLVVWSEASTAPAGDFVIDEANRAKRRGTLRILPRTLSWMELRHHTLCT